MDVTIEFGNIGNEIQFLERKLFDYNSSKIPGYSYDHFVIKIEGDLDSIVAGIHGRIGCNWLYIESLWVDENYRRRGFAKKMLRLAEDKAFERHCFGVYLYTYSFQSPDFYKKLGYEIFGELENFGEGSSKLLMKKLLPKE